jgi:predicted GTPase
MIELKSNKIKIQILEICNYFEAINNQHELSYNDGFDKEKILSDISIIKNSINQDSSFEIAFVGEYNAGKTSVINLLTNNNYAVDTNVATAKSTKSKWYDYTIIDTPGLGSGKPDHDEETKTWLAEADLLIYFLTPDLLTNNAGERLAKILKDFNRTKELMLVMNMIDQEGNDLDVYKEELQSVINPMLLSDYFPSFISAKYMEQSKEMTDIDDIKYYKEKSNFDVFVDTLNLFLMSKKQKALLSTPLILKVNLIRN